MLLPISLICAPKKLRRDGTSLVFIQYCLNESNKTLLNTGIAIPPNFWNKKLKRVADKLPEQFGKTEEPNSELKKQLRLAEDIITYAISRDMVDPVRFVKERFKPDFDISSLEEVALAEPEKSQRSARISFTNWRLISNQRKRRLRPRPSIL